MIHLYILYILYILYPLDSTKRTILEPEVDQVVPTNNITQEVLEMCFAEAHASTTHHLG